MPNICYRAGEKIRLNLKIDLMFENGSIHPVRDIALRHKSGTHAFHDKYQAEAQRNWLQEIEKKPTLFDGKVMLFDDLKLSDGQLSGSCYSTPYSSYVLWRNHHDKIGYHLFGLGILATPDGGVLLGEMAPHTFHAGRILSPAGSLDNDDVVDGFIDIRANIAREIGEETGLTLADMTIDDHAHLFVQGRVLVCVYRCMCKRSSAALCQMANTFIANDPDAELSRVFAVEKADDWGDQIAPFMPPILNWHFETTTR